MANYNVGKDNPMFNVHSYGRVGKEASNYKHGKCCKDKEYFCKCGNKITCQCAIYGTGNCRQCADKEHSKRLTGKKRPEQSKLWRGRNNPRFGKPAVHSKWSKYKNRWMRSSWEVKYAQYLDKNNIIWKYESKTFDLGEATYTPDFYLPKANKYIEIKGYWRDRDKKKFNLFEKKYPKIVILVLRKRQLQNLGIKL